MFTTSNNRPVFLELWLIKLPIAGFVSILQRVSGLLMVLSIPIAAVLFEQALSGPQGYAATSAFLNHWLVRACLLGILWSLLHHTFTGIRYLALDFGFGTNRESASRSAWVALIAGVAATLVVLVLSWGAGA